MKRGPKPKDSPPSPWPKSWRDYEKAIKMFRSGMSQQQVSVALKVPFQVASDAYVKGFAKVDPRFRPIRDILADEASDVTNIRDRSAAELATLIDTCGDPELAFRQSQILVATLRASTVNAAKMMFHATHALSEAAPAITQAIVDLTANMTPDMVPGYLEQLERITKGLNDLTTAAGKLLLVQESVAQHGEELKKLAGNKSDSTPVGELEENFLKSLAAISSRRAPELKLVTPSKSEG